MLDKFYYIYYSMQYNVACRFSEKPVIRSGAAASRQIGARPARDQEQATRSQDISYSVGFFNFSDSEKKFVYQSR